MPPKPSSASEPGSGTAVTEMLSMYAVGLHG